VHRGHQALLAKLSAKALTTGLPAAVLTFEPHPREYFTHEVRPVRLTSLREKVGLLEQHGVLVVETDVLSLELPDQPGILAQIANKLAKAKINIEYAYGTAGGSNTHPTLIVRVSDTKRAAKLLKKL